MINEGLILTFGVELEMIFAFHEELFVNYKLAHSDPYQEPMMDQDELERQAQLMLKKDLSDSERLHMSQVNARYEQTRPMYMGWGVRENETRKHPHPAVKWNPSLRTYGDEPLEIAREVLRLAPRTNNFYYWAEEGPLDTFYVAVPVDIGNGQKHQDFGAWHLTNDNSLVGVDKRTLQAYLHRKKASREEYSDDETVYDFARGYNDAANWDSHGIELVSRILSPTPASFDEIDLLLSTIKGQPPHRHGALISDFCGLHIHIGMPPATSSTFDLPTLQHLALLLCAYEKHINTLHPSHRIMPDEDIIDEMDSLPPAALDIDTNIPYGFERLRLSAVRARLFAHDMTIPLLCDLMGEGDKARIVNWTNLKRGGGGGGGGGSEGGMQQGSGGKGTLEFRQHEGTLSAESVKWWALFCMGLVRLANWMALRGNGYGGVGGVGGDGGNGDGGNDRLLRFEERHDCMSVWDLLEGMEFPGEGREYFRRRGAFYARG